MKPVEYVICKGKSKRVKLVPVEHPGIPNLYRFVYYFVPCDVEIGVTQGGQKSFMPCPEHGGEPVNFPATAYGFERFRKTGSTKDLTMFENGSRFTGDFSPGQFRFASPCDGRATPTATTAT